MDRELYPLATADESSVAILPRGAVVQWRMDGATAGSAPGGARAAFPIL